LVSAFDMERKLKKRSFFEEDFDRSYDSVIKGNNFSEDPDYYDRERPRYRRTVEYICNLQLPECADVLEIGGGQICLLLSKLFGDKCTLADVNDEFAESVTRFGIEFMKCDLLNDDLSRAKKFDMIILCEVVEHLAVPPYLILEKARQLLKPGGFLFLTTPNLYRLRNVIRLALGMKVFDHFFYPDPGVGIGHPIEYSPEHLAWQVETAGYSVRLLERTQLSNAGVSFQARLGRFLLAPLLWAIPRWRDNLVCVAGVGDRN